MFFTVHCAKEIYLNAVAFRNFRQNSKEADASSFKIFYITSFCKSVPLTGIIIQKDKKINYTKSIKLN